ncbi:MAG: Tn3 family transposase, partial [Comamonas sp.]|nr:Tn3 family transposase [Comamonas sp.]
MNAGLRLFKRKSLQLIVRKLASYPRQNGLAIALREIGRIERTLFILDWLQSVELRR